MVVVTGGGGNSSSCSGGGGGSILLKDLLRHPTVQDTLPGTDEKVTAAAVVVGR